MALYQNISKTSIFRLDTILTLCIVNRSIIGLVIRKLSSACSKVSLRYAVSCKETDILVQIFLPMWVGLFTYAADVDVTNPITASVVTPNAGD